ncbi:MAG TPA: hypothetical protein VF039_01945 [Longimicrobiales bacterium]
MTVLVAGAVMLGACAEQPTEPAEVTIDIAASRKPAPAPTPDPNVVDRSSAILPDGRLVDTDLFELCQLALNGEDYVCPPSTDVIDWYLDAFYGALAAEQSNTLTLYNLAADLVVAYDAMLYLPASPSNTFGYTGEFTEVIVETERDIKRFWDIYSSDIQVVPMHGTMLLDTARVARVYRTVFGIAPATAQTFAATVRSVMLSSIVFNGGNHPFFSFNAFAASFGGPFPDKIVMGDGMMEGYAALGFGDVAPQAIFAHEFGHHVQFENGYFDDPDATTDDDAANTRYTELMADAYSAYYLTHARGLAMNKHRVALFLQAFFEIGDCAFTNPGHHGTPAQRMRAAEFGFEVADQARKQGHILTSEQFHDLFVAAYPGMVAPDAV